MKIWDTNTGTLKYNFDSTNGGHEFEISSLIKLNSNLIASAAGVSFGEKPFGEIKIWDLSTGSLKFTFSDAHSKKVEALVVLENNLMASGSEDETIKIWNYLNGNLKYSRLSLIRRGFNSKFVLNSKNVCTCNYFTLSLWYITFANS